MNLENNIRNLRKAQGLTQSELGTKLDIDQKVITSYERGIARPPLERLIQMAEIFNVTLEELVGVRLRLKEETQPKKSSRVGKLLDAFEKLKPAQQRAILQQTEALSDKL